MILLCLGLSLWMGAHLFKRVLPIQRAALGKAGLGVVAIMVLSGIVLMVVGYRGLDEEVRYELPFQIRHLNNLLMLIAIFLMDAGRVGGVVAAKLRHPMLWGIVVWAVAHLLVNGDLASLVLFGGLGVWALVQMAAVNRAEGPWTPPAKGPIFKDLRLAVLSLVLYGIIAFVHVWLGYPVIALLA